MKVKLFAGLYFCPNTRKCPSFTLIFFHSPLPFPLLSSAPINGGHLLPPPSSQPFFSAFPPLSLCILSPKHQKTRHLKISPGPLPPPQRHRSPTIFQYPTPPLTIFSNPPTHLLPKPKPLSQPTPTPRNIFPNPKPYPQTNFLFTHLPPPLSVRVWKT